MGSKSAYRIVTPTGGFGEHMVCKGHCFMFTFMQHGQGKKPRF